MKMKIEKCKDNLFLILPRDAVAQLEWGHGDIVDVEVVGDELKVIRTLTHHDHAMEIARKAMREYSETFAALAKS